MRAPLPRFHARARTGGFTEPVDGRLRVTALTESTKFPGTIVLHGVIEAAGVKPMSATHRCRPPSRSRVAPGTVLPVVLDRADPHAMVVRWRRGAGRHAG